MRPEVSEPPIVEALDRIEQNRLRRFLTWALAVVMPPIAIIGFLVAATDPARPYLGLAAVAAVVGAIAILVLVLTLNVQRKRRKAFEEQERLRSINDAVRSGMTEALRGEKAGLQLQLGQEPETRWELAYEIMTERQTWGYANLEFACDIREDGAAFLRRTIEVDVRGAASQVEQSLNSTPAEENKWVMPQVRLLPLSTNVAAEMSDPYIADNGWLIRVRFDPPLGHRDKAVLALEEDLPPDYYAVGYTPDRLELQHITESWIGWRVDRPMRRFNLQVYFPVGCEPRDLRPEVRIQIPFRGSKQPRRDYKEEERTRGAYHPVMRGRRQEATWTVDWPIVGRIYLIRWLPLDKPVQ